jgi:hypothetical protein
MTPERTVTPRYTVTAAGLVVMAMAACGLTLHGASASVASRPAASDVLFGVSCRSWAQCMAVGTRTTGSPPIRRPLAEWWDGVNWQVVPMPSPATLVYTQVSEVSCSSPADCLAVGYHYQVIGQDTEDLAEEWNGRRWQIIQSGNPVAGTSSAFLSDVSCSNPAGCMAVGGYAGQSGHGRALAELWEQGRWRVLPVPVPAGAQSSELNGISCGTGLCMAVGTYRGADGRILTLADRWTGSSWSMLHPANVGQSVSVLEGVACRFSSLCMAVGFSYTTQEMAFAELWQGDRWRMVPVGRLADSALIRAACPDSSRCLAVGFAAGRPLTEAWSGRSWQVLPAAGPSDNQAGRLDGLSCRTQTLRCIAVGSGHQPGNPGGRSALAEAWSGRAWALMTAGRP